MRVTGLTISKKDTVNKNGETELCIKETTSKEKNREEEFLFGEMIAHMKDNFMIITFMETENMYGRMDESMRGTGQIIRCMEKEFLSGQMVENTRVNTRMTKSMVLEHLNSKMVECMRENGAKESSTGEESFVRKIK